MRETLAPVGAVRARFAVPRIVASAPKVVIQEWIQGVPMAEIIRYCHGPRLPELTDRAARSAPGHRRLADD
jgi:predicted unusual protein kinase regulating ubiquinone biosynthesis (AarF/ABC1/UbiB family)